MKKMCKVFLLAALAVVMAMAMAGCGSTKVDVTKDVFVLFSGVDGDGRAEVRFSKEDPSDYTPEFLYDLMDAGKLAADDWQKLFTISSAVIYEVSPERNLSNGDTVTVTVDVDEDILNSMKISAKPATLTFTVEGLTEVTEVTPFQNFEISFSGISPNCTAEYTKSEEIDGTTVYYSIEESGPYQDGQTLTAKASLSDNTLYRLTEDTKTVTVSGVEKYLSDVSELNAETKEAMRSQADAVVDGMIQKWEGYFSYDGFEYVSAEFLARTSGISIGNINAVYLFYKINVLDGSNSFPFYYYVGFENVLQHLDGSQEVDLNNTRKPSIGLYEQMRDYGTLETRTSEVQSFYSDAYQHQVY